MPLLIAPERIRESVRCENVRLLTLREKRAHPLPENITTFQANYADLFVKRVHAFPETYPYPEEKIPVFFPFSSRMSPEMPFFHLPEPGNVLLKARNTLRKKKRTAILTGSFPGPVSYF